MSRYVHKIEISLSKPLIQDKMKSKKMKIKQKRIRKIRKKNYNSKREDLEEKDQVKDGRNVIL